MDHDSLFLSKHRVPPIYCKPTASLNLQSARTARVISMTKDSPVNTAILRALPHWRWGYHDSTITRHTHKRFASVRFCMGPPMSAHSLRSCRRIGGRQAPHSTLGAHKKHKLQNRLEPFRFQLPADVDPWTNWNSQYQQTCFVFCNLADSPLPSSSIFTFSSPQAGFQQSPPPTSAITCISAHFQGSKAPQRAYSACVPRTVPENREPDFDVQTLTGECAWQIAADRRTSDC